MFDAKFYDTLTRLQLQVFHKSSLIMSGSRKSVQKGTSAEFSDFREYMPGDDLRRMDWISCTFGSIWRKKKRWFLFW